MRRVLLAALVVSLSTPAAAHAHRVRLAAPAQFDVAVAHVLARTQAGASPACALGSLVVSDLRFALQVVCPLLNTPPPCPQSAA
jgi:hypothetical protein